jgi:membrane protein implicated in regulation of membrane protease activity
VPTSIAELGSHPWIVWILIALASAMIEIATPSFGFIFASLAGVVAALASTWVGVPAQIAVFAVVLVASLVVLRPRLIEKFHVHDNKMPSSRSQALVGKAGQVTEAIDPVTGRGRVTVEGEDWAARSSSPLGVGSVIQVDGSDGIVLVVNAKVSGH